VARGEWSARDLVTHFLRRLCVVLLQATADPLPLRHGDLPLEATEAPRRMRRQRAIGQNELGGRIELACCFPLA
jgi:hypothetical protein